MSSQPPTHPEPMNSLSVPLTSRTYEEYQGPFPQRIFNKSTTTVNTGKSPRSSRFHESVEGLVDFGEALDAMAPDTAINRSTTTVATHNQHLLAEAYPYEETPRQPGSANHPYNHDPSHVHLQWPFKGSFKERRRSDGLSRKLRRWAQRSLNRIRRLSLVR
ncbi:hypothetical protein S7711_10556 [Stachybotrys chartarum IBT 7711]|uniref:Uncharacterized protein n=1 Tax=Stachybotrys chartarum (strain CBS 109288 / IBT 7711) TaxID=1280523 RepID=A0A084AZC3_STACB|nr:hypothetical protein S7711_10556 [Stachybotrys chartarum IBT 7711]